MSSISGFSTNSHLEDTGDDGGTGGGGGGSKDDKTSRGDPFAGMISASTTTSQASDPFAAFSVGGGDHFSSAGERKQNRVFRVVYICTMSYVVEQLHSVYSVQCIYMYMYM